MITAASGSLLPARNGRTLESTSQTHFNGIRARKRSMKQLLAVAMVLANACAHAAADGRPGSGRPTSQDYRAVLPISTHSRGHFDPVVLGNASRLGAALHNARSTVLPT